MGHSTIMSIRITGNADDAIKAFEQTTTKAAAFGSALGGLAVKGLTALWDSVKGFTSDVVSMSDSTDKFMNTMSFAGLDTSAVQKAAQATRKYADETVYGLDDIQNTTAQLAANGISDYMGLTEAAGNLNAVAGGNADTFKSVALMLTQTAGAGKLTTENWNQLANAIPGASGKLQEAMLKNGAYTGNFRDAMAKGEITADEFNQALLQLGLTDVAKDAATSTQTIEGAMGNLEAAIVGGLSDAFNVFKPTITSTIGTIGDKVASFASSATSDLSAFFEAFKDTGGLQVAQNVIKAVADMFVTFGDALAGLVDALNPFSSQMSNASSAGELVANAFKGAASVIETLAKAFRQFGDFVNANSEQIAQALVAIGAGLAVFKVASLISAVVSALQGFSAAAQLAAVAQTLLNLAMSANPLVLLVSLIAALTASLIYFFSQTETGKQMWSDFTETISGLIQRIGRFFSELGTSIKEAFNGAAQWAQSTWQSVVDWFSGIPSTISGFFTNAGNILKDAGKKIIQGLFDGLKSAWEKVTGWISGIGDWIREHKGPPAYDAVLLTQNGRLIMQGFAKGLNQGFDSNVTGAIRRINNRLGGLDLSLDASAGAGSTINNIEIHVDGVVSDPDGTVRQLRKMFNEYDMKRA